MFIVALKRLSHPRTAVRGNLIGALGMLLAIVVTIVLAIQMPEISGLGYWLIAIGLALGIVIGAIFAVKVPMTGMPQMVGLLNGLGGGASLLVAASVAVARAVHRAARAAGHPRDRRHRAARHLRRGRGDGGREPRAARACPLRQ